jgi:hypothetical protein
MDSFEKSVGMLFHVHTKYLPHTENYNVENPDPDVFGPPGSGFLHQQAKK